MVYHRYITNFPAYSIIQCSLKNVVLSVTRGTMAGVARPPRMVFLRGDESKVESNDECGEATARFVLVVESEDCETACESGVECCSCTTVEGPAWQWLSQCGDVYLSSSTFEPGHAWRFRWLHENGRLVGSAVGLRIANVIEWSGAAKLRSQSSSLVCLVELRCAACVDVSIQWARVVLSWVRRALISQSNPSVLRFFFILLLGYGFLGTQPCISFSAISIKTHLLSVVQK